ncbi:IAA-alanine resistance protein 1-like [Coffea arabica]|uniref:IAA-alanine resistance protein 1-like n=1 Tax=Coffea arabica TaxID=13443 RepID=A0A6P6V3X6_COFAR|nr:IAA-alanine resistance protein 1-like isoform X1 [Coffea arabica]
MESLIELRIQNLLLKVGVSFVAVLMIYGLGVTAAHEDFHVHSPHDHDHHCGHGHLHHHHHHHHNEGEHHHGRHDDVGGEVKGRRKLPEELAEEEDLKLYGFGGGDHHQHQHQHHHHGMAAGDEELSGLGLWIHAMGCSLLVSLASLICLIILPILFTQGKPSKVAVDSLALFGAGAMLGDAFLHQLPHAFGGEHSHSHDHHLDHAHAHVHSGHEHFQSHAHSLKDLSVGLSILAGIILFLLVEKLVRYVEDSSGAGNVWGHSHHHHHKQTTKLKTENDASEDLQGFSEDEKHGTSTEKPSEEKALDGSSSNNLAGEEKQIEHTVLRKRNIGTSNAEDKANAGATEDETNLVVANGSKNNIKLKDKEEAKSSSNLVFGYLNLISDGVHNFTDGMALGSAFLLYGSVGGWSRTLFLLAHELPQEIGDFGILVRSGFSVSKALFFNFLSALVALAGTALVLMFGQDPGQSSLIEGFTAGGFIYIAVAGVLAEMNSSSSTLKSTTIQLLSLMTGMAVALWISLVE